jgi:phosphatidyl-myo-inositol alpha-mannosyltransferase
VRLAHVTPTFWPEVMRGTERLVHDLGCESTARGHEVTVLTSHRSRPRTTIEDGMRVVRRWRPPELATLRSYEYHLPNMANVFAGLRSSDFDLAHVHFPSDAWAAAFARRRGGPPFVFTLHGLPTREYLVARRYRLEMLRAVVARAHVCTVGSEAAARPFRRYLFRDPEVVHPGIRAADFDVAAERAPEPTLVCPASLGDPRKRAGLLFSAFARIRDRRPGARLLIFEGRDPVHSRAQAPAAADGVEVLPAQSSSARLAEVYASSWATVLPAVGEAFGMVLTESLAAGTPVVADRSGAGPEIVTDPRIGRLFASDDEEDLARAMDEALDLAAAPGTAAACRSRAADFDWARIVPEWERLYRDGVRT